MPLSANGEGLKAPGRYTLEEHLVLPKKGKCG
uniref:Uncharacterized protein n=1 Tax=Anguilla anguilla TaxID=7936 RepID=A0A0E9T3F9_ANGAN